MSLQGVVVAALGTFVVGATASGMSLGLMLDVTVPALLLGQAIGHLGCFFAACCAGLPTSSRWGLWSSGRAVGARRIPARFDGIVFVAGFALYLVGRQLLFPLRNLPRKSARCRQITLVVASATFLAAVLTA